MADLVTMIRQFVGLDRRVSNPDADWVQAKLDDQAARIKALDAQIDAQRKSRDILQPRRRSTDAR